MLLHLHILFHFCCTNSTRCPLGTTAEEFPLVRASKEDSNGERQRPAVARFRDLWKIVLVAIFLQVALLSATCQSQHIDAFDGGEPRFRLWKDDAQAVFGKPQRGEPGVETVELAHGNGSFVYLVYPIEPCAIIPELNATIRIRSAQSGMRIGFRIIFPHARHPATHAPLTEVILGTAHDGAGRWSTSSLSNIIPMVEDRQRFLRRRFGPEVDLREPYVDGVILNVFGLPGATKLQVDDLVVDGMIAPGVMAETIDERGRLRATDTPTAEQLRTIQTGVPRWIQHQGESLAYLQSLGFNGVLTSQNNDPLVIEQASETGMGLIMPPPNLVPTEAQADQYKNVNAWLLGLALNESQLDSARDRVALMSRYPRTMTRPLIGEAWEMYGAYSRLSDWISVPIPLATTVRSSQESSQILASDLRPIAGRGAPLTSIWTQLSSEWVAQRAMTSRLLGYEQWQLPDHDRLQARLQLIRSIMHGSRGWIFRSPAPLDAGDETAVARADSYTHLNREVELLMPWIQAGESQWRSIQVNSPDHAASILDTPNSQLVLIVAAGPSDQICSPAPAPERISITLPVSGQPRQVYRITHCDLQRCATQATPGGMVVTIDRPGLVEQIVSVVDNGPITYLRNTFSRLGPAIVEGRIDTASQILQIAQMTLVARQLPASDPAWEQIRQAQSAQRAAGNFLSRSELARACEAAELASLLSQGVIRSSWQTASGQFESSSSSPLIASPLSLPLHWELDRVLQGRTWQRTDLPGVPFSNLENWNAAGWRSDHRLAELVDSQIKITPEVGPGGFPTMFLSASSRTGQPIPSGYAGASMRVTSPRMRFPAGSLVHIEGLVQISSPADQSQSGLLVCDNCGGESLGQLISSYDRSESTWRRISLFRMVTRDDGLELYFETRGSVQAAVTDLTIERIMPTQNRDLPISTSTAPIDTPE